MAADLYRSLRRRGRSKHHAARVSGVLLAHGEKGEPGYKTLHPVGRGEQGGQRQAGRSGGLTAKQFEAMKPTSQWNADYQKSMRESLKETSSGAVLSDTLDKFQDGGSVGRLRKNIEKRLAGEDVDPTSAARADAVVSALRDAPDWAPERLYRGMSVKGKPENVLAKYKPGDTLDLNLTSFSSDRAVAKRFQQNTFSPGKARIMTELVGGKKKALPIQNFARDSRLFKEKEWVSGGRFRIIEAKRSPDGGILLRIEQEDSL